MEQLLQVIAPLCCYCEDSADECSGFVGVYIQSASEMPQPLSHAAESRFLRCPVQRVLNGAKDGPDSRAKINELIVFLMSTQPTTVRRSHPARSTAPNRVRITAET